MKIMYLFKKSLNIILVILNQITDTGPYIYVDNFNHVRGSNVWVSTVTNLEQV